MGNNKSSGLKLTNEDLEILSKKTRFSKDEILQVHSAFLVTIYTTYLLFFLLKSIRVFYSFKERLSKRKVRQKVVL